MLMIGIINKFQIATPMEEIEGNKTLSVQIEKCIKYIQEHKQEMENFMEVIDQYKEDKNIREAKQAMLAYM